MRYTVYGENSTELGKIHEDKDNRVELKVKKLIFLLKNFVEIHGCA